MFANKVKLENNSAHLLTHFFFCFFFNSVTLELSRCDKGHIVHKAYNANFLSLYRNYLLILILNYVPQVTTYVTLCKQCNLLDMHNKFVM